MQQYRKAERVVVTGACGFLGQALIRVLLERERQVTAVDLSEKERLLSARRGLRFVAAERLFEQSLEADIWYHLAWAGSAGEGRKDGVLQAQNIRQTAEAVAQARRWGCHTFVFAGSIMEAEMAALQAAGKALQGTDCYACAKRCAGEISRCLAAEAGMRHITGRVTNVYGAGERSQRLICRTLEQLAQGEMPEFTSGTQLYDFIYVTDAARAFLAMGEQGKDGQTYVVGSGEPKPLRKWLELLLEEAGGKGIFGKVAFSGISLTEADYDISAVVADTGFCCRVDFTSGIRRTMAWQKEGRI